MFENYADAAADQFKALVKELGRGEIRDRLRILDREDMKAMVHHYFDDEAGAAAENEDVVVDMVADAVRQAAEDFVEA